MKFGFSNIGFGSPSSRPFQRGLAQNSQEIQKAKAPRVPAEPSKLAPGSKVPEHALERMREARLHVQRSIRAAEVLGERFEEFSRLLGPEKAELTGEQIRSYVSRSTNEFKKTEATVKAFAEGTAEETP